MRLTCLLLVLFPLAASSAILDHEITRGVRENLDSDSLVISLTEERPRKQRRTETIFSIESPHKRFSLSLDPNQKRVILELGWERKDVSFKGISEERRFGSIVAEVHGRAIRLWMDCEFLGKVTLSSTLSETFPRSVRHHIKVLRERRYSIDLDVKTSMMDIMVNKICSGDLKEDTKIKKAVKDEMEEQIKEDPEDEPMQAQEPDNDLYTPMRGDIPLHDCDDNVLLQKMLELMKLIQALQKELEAQRAETQSLRRILEQCDFCRPESASQTRDTCRNRPCFPGVECRDFEEGPRCGRCPPGYVGDGRTCRPGVTCEQQPCFRGVRCYDTVEGFQCGPCPSGYTGNGQQCKPRAGCENNPCSPGVQCQNTYEPPFYRCGPCPPGFTGNGTDCHDLDECDLAEPCDPRVHCTNLSPGFRCGPCPVGFTGSEGLEGVGLDEAGRVRQHCYDIDECADGRNGGCKLHSICHNTEGSYTCGQCKNGYVGNQTVGCHSSPGLCPDGSRCDANGECVRVSSTRYGCKCKVGWAGDGRVCGPDRDLDGWPDYDLSCSDQRCRKDN